MKGKPQSSLYFSAYPLKAVNQESASVNSENQSPYLKSILSGKSRTVSRVRVFPMVNPYIKPIPESAAPAKRVKKAKDVDPSGKEWFHNYE